MPEGIREEGDLLFKVVFCEQRWIVIGWLASIR